MIEFSESGLTDKASYHSYEQIYPELLCGYVGRPLLNILEIGTGRGGGLLILSSIFPDATVYGLDLNYSMLQIGTGNTNIRLLEKADQTDRRILDAIPNLDIVIEDASHNYSASITTFEMLRDRLNPGAIYIIEDVYPQYLELYEKDDRFEIFDLRHAKNRGDDIIAVHRT